MKETSPAQEIEKFLDYIDELFAEYRAAYDTVNEEDRRLQDLVHEMEFAQNKAERNRTATKLHDSRVRRRKNKDIVKRNEKVIKFFEELNHKSTLNKMRILLKQQKKEEEYLSGERTYTKRVSTTE